MYKVKWYYLDDGEHGCEYFDNEDDALQFFDEWQEGVAPWDYDIFTQTLYNPNGEVIKSM